jgi:hypothetical protein
MSRNKCQLFPQTPEPFCCNLTTAILEADASGRAVAFAVSKALIGTCKVGVPRQRTVSHSCRLKAGLARARDEGVRLGRPMLEDADPARAAKVRAMRARGVGVRKIARELGVGVGTVLRLAPAE